MKATNPIHVGACGFSGSIQSYFRRLGAVEVQRTFYILPRLETASRWRRTAPEEFVFTMKAWQGITHGPSSPTWKKAKLPPDTDHGRYGDFRPTDEVFGAWEATRRFAKELRASFVVIQSPPSFGMSAQNEVNLESFFTTIDRGGLTLGWEPRGDWSRDTTRLRRLFSRLNLVHVVDPFWDVPVSDLPISYFRLHGRGKRYNYAYDYLEDDLQRLAGLASEVSRRGPVYVMFNVVKMREAAATFLDILDRSSALPSQ